MACVGEDRAVGQAVERVPGDDARPSGRGEEDLASAERLIEREDAHAIQHGFERADGVRLDDGDMPAEQAQPPGDAASHRAVAEDDEAPGLHEQVRLAHEAFDDARADAMLVLHDELERAVVDDDDRERTAP